MAMGPAASLSPPFTLPFHFFRSSVGGPSRAASGSLLPGHSPFLLFSNMPRQCQAAAWSCSKAASWSSSKAAAWSSSKLRSPGCTPHAVLLTVDPFIQVAFVDQHSSSAPFPAAVVGAMAFAAYHVFEGMPTSVRLSLLLSLVPTPVALCCSSLEILMVDCSYTF
jgi:hypothetical protein